MAIHANRLVDAQTVDQLFYPVLLLLKAHVDQLLPLAQQLVQVGYPPLVLSLNLDSLLFSDCNPPLS